MAFNEEQQKPVRMDMQSVEEKRKKKKHSKNSELNLLCLYAGGVNLEEKKKYEEVLSDLKHLLNSLDVDDDGRITFEGERYVFIPKRLLVNALFVEALRVLGASLKALIWPFSGLAGELLARHLIDRVGVPPEDVLKGYAKFNNPRGWGITEVVEIDLDEPRAVVRMRNSAFAKGVKEAVGDVKEEFPFYDCPWGSNFTGALKVALEKTGRPVPELFYEEVKCEALGDEYCEWHIKKGEG